MNAAEVGQVQHFYQDKDGENLNIRRDYTGEFTAGVSEMMPTGDNNYFGSIYIGPNNPTYIDVNKKEQPDYRREPQDEVDAAALQHDKRYDKLKVAGAGDALFNRKTIPADKALVSAATMAEKKGASGGIDNVTGKAVSRSTQTRGQRVRQFFSYLLSAGAFKGDAPKEDKRSPGPHVIK